MTKVILLFRVKFPLQAMTMINLEKGANVENVQAKLEGSDDESSNVNRS